MFTKIIHQYFLVYKMKNLEFAVRKAFKEFN